MPQACDPAAMSDPQDAAVPLVHSDLAIEGWHDGFRKISFTKLLQREAGLGLADAKRATDEVLGNRPIRVRVPRDRRASFIGEAKALGIRDILVGMGGDRFEEISCGQVALRYPCPCCGYITFDEPPGSYDICEVCFWEDDGSQLRWPQNAGGANVPSLIEAQRNFANFGACEQRLIRYVRQPTSSDRRDPGWRPIDLAVDDFEESGETSTASHPTDSTTLYWWRPTFWRDPD